MGGGGVVACSGCGVFCVFQNMIECCIDCQLLTHLHAENNLGCEYEGGKGCVIFMAVTAVCVCGGVGWGAAINPSIIGGQQATRKLHRRSKGHVRK